MATAKQVEQMASRPDRFASESPLNEYRIYGTRNVKHVRIVGEVTKYSQVYERDPYSQVQNFLYKRAMMGLKMYAPEEIETMHWEKRNRIQKVYKRTQKILNLWKQELANDWTNHLLQVLFPKSQLINELVEGSFVDPAFKNTVTFEDLGVTKAKIIAKLHEEGVLPPDFYSLK
jgi:hypothetical protein